MDIEEKGQEINFIKEITLNKIEDFYNITDQNEFQEKIFVNTFNIAKILNIFNKLLYEKFVLSKKEAEILLHCLNFVDLMNLFIHPNEMDKICITIRSIKEQISIINNLELKDDILKKIKYTEKSYIYYKKKLFKTLFFKDSETIYREFDGMMNNLMDQRFLKQLQNAFYIFSQKIDEDKRNILQNKINNLKEKNKSMKRNIEQGWYNNYHYNNYNNRGYYTYNDDMDTEYQVKEEEIAKDMKEFKNNYHHHHSLNHIKGGYNNYNSYNYNNQYNYNDYNSNYNLSHNQNYKYGFGNYYSNKSNNRKTISYENNYPPKNEYEDKNIKTYHQENRFVENKAQNREKPVENVKDDQGKENQKPNINNLPIPTNVNTNPNLIKNYNTAETPREQNTLNDYYNQNFFVDYIYYNKKNNTFSKTSGEAEKASQINQHPKSTSYVKEFRNNNYYKNNYYYNQSNYGENNNNYSHNYNYSNQFNNYQMQINNINNNKNDQKRPKSNSFHNENITDFKTSQTLQTQTVKLNSDQTERNYLQIDVDKMFQTNEFDKLDNKTLEKNDVIIPSSVNDKKHSTFKPAKKHSHDNNDQEDFMKLNNSFNSENLEEEEEKMAEFLKKHPDYNKEEYEESFSDESEDDIIIHNEESENEDNDSSSDTKNNKIIFDMERNHNTLNTNFEDKNIQQKEDLHEEDYLKKNLNSDPFFSKQQMNNMPPQEHNMNEFTDVSDKSLTNYQNYIFSNYANFFYRGRDSNMHREYFTLKCLEQEKPDIISKEMNDFENKILIPLYQKITVNVEKKKKYYYYTFNKYKNIIYKVLYNDKVLLKVEPYGSHVNNFLIDLSDIDICIVPKCPLSDFNIYLEKLKEFIVLKKIGECRLTHTNNRYMLIKIIDAETKFVIDITVHNLLPILNTNLICLYSLLDQRFHILGIYLKYWSKINKIHGAADNYLSSYAILLMLIHFLQKIVEPKVLPNLQKLENKIKNYEYNNGGKTIRTNIFFEKDLLKIKKEMEKECNNKDSATILLIKFFEYYSYYFDYHNQKISIHKELIDTVKTNIDNVAFSIDDPFDETHDPGRSMSINSVQFNKFLTAMKKEINYILNGEYNKRLDLVSKK